MKEKVLENKTCKYCNCKFEITDKDLEYYEKISPFFSGKKYSIPSPTLCPDCRQQRRMSFRNEIKLYKRKCDFSGKEIISMYSPDKPYKVYDQNEWWSDKWDAMDYGIEFDFEKGFFEQFEEIFIKVPKISLLNKSSENSFYVNDVAQLKNCYLFFNGANSKDSYYINAGLDIEYCVDCDWIFGNSNNCYDSYKLSNCYNCKYCYYTLNSSNCIFCLDCDNCKNCIGCVNLVNKEYYIFNKKCTKFEYEELSKKIISSKVENTNFKNIFNDFILKYPRKNLRTTNTVESFGDYIINVKNSNNLFDCFNIEDSKNTWNSSYGINLFDVYNIGSNSENIYCSIGIYRSNNIKFSMYIDSSYNIIYCINCDNCSNCFGCTGLRNKQYCILNKQYTKEEYEKLVPRIIEHMMKTGEWGEFFPSWMSPFGYNETVAMEYYPETPPSIPPLPGEGGRFKWSDYEPPFPKVEKIIPASKLPDNIKDIPDDILNWAIECEVTRKPFRIIAQELEFYRKHNLPIPRIHPDQRNLDRMELRNPRKLFDRKCDKCGKNMKTTYSPERKEIVYCEECYNREIY